MPRRTRRSGRSSPRSSRRPANRSSSSSIQQSEHAEQAIAAALEAGQPPDFAFGLLFSSYIGQWAFDDRLVDLSDAIGHFSDLFDPDVLELGDVAQRQHRPKGPVRAADGPYDQPRPRLEEPPGARGLHPRGHSEGVGSVLVVLVRPGAAGRAPGHGARRHLGRRAAHVGVGVDTENGFFQFLTRGRGGVRDPRWPPRHRRPRDQAQAHRGHRQLHRHSTARAARRPTQ